MAESVVSGQQISSKHGNEIALESTGVRLTGASISSAEHGACSFCSDDAAETASCDQSQMPLNASISSDSRFGARSCFNGSNPAKSKSLFPTNSDRSEGQTTT